MAIARSRRRSSDLITSQGDAHDSGFTQGAARRAALVAFAGAALGAEDPAARSTPRSRPTRSRPTRTGFNKVNPNIEIKWVRDSTGVITAKLLAEKANPQADVVMGVAASSLALLDKQGMLEPVRAAQPRRDHEPVPRQEEPAGLVGHGRLGRDGLLQHRRGAEEGHPQARDLEGPDQAGLQGPDRDAESGVVGHRLLRRHRLAHALGRRQRQGRRLEVHGRAAREHRPVHALGLQALQHGGGRRVRRRHLVRVPRQHATRPRARRSTWCSRRKAWAGTSRRSRSTRARRSSRRRRSSPTGPRARTRCCSTARTSRSPRSPASPRRWPTCRPTTRSAWSRWTSSTAADNRERILAEWNKRYNAKSEEPQEAEATRAVSGSTSRLRRHPQGVRRPSRRCTTSTSTIAQGRVRLLPRPVGLRQDDAAAHHRRARDADRRARSCRPSATSRVLPPAERDYGIVFQSYALFPNLIGRRQRRLRPRQPQGRQGGRRSRARRRAAEAGRPAGQRAEVPGPALGRPAAAHRARARARHLARAAAARRAAVGARRARARAPAPGDPLAAAQARRDDDHGHARPGRGALGRRPHRRHEPGRDRAGRHADGDLPRPGDAVRRRLRRQDQRARRARCSRARDLRIGASRFACEHDTDAERDVKIYLRPEDVLARPIAPGDANVFDGAIDKIEFLGSYCLVRVTRRGDRRAADHRLPVAQLPRRAGLEVGSRLPLQAAARADAVLLARVARSHRVCRPRRSPPRARCASARTGPTASPSARCSRSRSRCVAFLALPLRDDPRQGAAGHGTARSSASPTSRATSARRRCCSRSWQQRLGRRRW